MLFVLMVALMVIVVLTRDSTKKIFQTKCRDCISNTRYFEWRKTGSLS